jgi:hypothetical protein
MTLDGTNAISVLALAFAIVTSVLAIKSRNPLFSEAMSGTCGPGGS